MTTREAQPQDAAEVAGVNVRSWQVAYRGLFPDDYLDGLRAEDRMAHYTFGDGRPGSPATLVAVIDATICGFVATGPAKDEDAADAGEVYAIYVGPRPDNNHRPGRHRIDKPTGRHLPRIME